MGKVIAAVLLACAFLAVSGQAFADAGTIRVHVTGFRNGQGQLLCALFDTDKNFPSGEPVARAKAAVSQSGSDCVFPNVGPGEYAVSVFHDENGNGKLDKLLFGIPKEGYGVSNNKTYATHPPRFAESTFRYEGPAELVLQVTLRY